MQGPRGEPGPPGLSGDLTELDIFPELRLDYTMDKACADSIRSNYSFSGTVEEITQQREALDILLNLPTRFMTYDHISRLSYMIDEGQNDGSRVCDRSEAALVAFSIVRENNPMGQWRHHTLETYWRYCSYQGEGFQLLNDGRYGDDEDRCAVLFSWMPESWKPPTRD